MRVRITTIIGVFLIFVLATNVALASSARHNLRSFARATHTGKRRASGLFSDDPDQDSDFKIAPSSVKHHIISQFNSISAMMNVCSVLISPDASRIISTNTSQSYSNNLPDIFIPPRISL